ncbi:MAG: hypothetical protein QNJ46_26575 [Leptolyngbyaceae cyanobacterium MO_188.B28]|nr:hypothetical protein [Leptolyngbyaceae cyanobacterium MO_188.B28]
METQQIRSGDIWSVEAKNDGLAILFLFLGAPHIYGALRSRRMRSNSAPRFTINRYFKIMLLAASIAGATEILISGHYL